MIHKKLFKQKVTNNIYRAKYKNQFNKMINKKMKIYNLKRD